MDNITLTITPTVEDYLALEKLTKDSSNDPTGFLTHIVSLYREQTEKHYIYDDEKTEFEAGQATTRIDIKYLLGMIEDSIESLDYKKPDDHNKLADLVIKLNGLYHELI